MYRWCLLVLVCLLFAPAAAVAQESRLLPRSRISVTPFVGYRIGYTASGQLTITGETGPNLFDVEETHGGAAVAGVQLEVRALGPISVIGSVAYSRPGEVTIAVIDPQNPQRVAPEVWLAKAGVAFRLPDPVPDSRSFHPAAFIVVAPGIMRESLDPWLPAAKAEPLNHPALSLGSEIVTSLGAPWIALSIGVEDFITFRNLSRRETEEARALSELFGQDLTVDFNYGPSHVIMLRAGLSLRFF